MRQHQAVTIHIAESTVDIELDHGETCGLRRTTTLFPP